MNCPTRDPEPSHNPHFNQSPPPFDNDLVSNRDMTSFADSPRQQEEQGNSSGIGGGGDGGGLSDIPPDIPNNNFSRGLKSLKMSGGRFGKRILNSPRFAVHRRDENSLYQPDDGLDECPRPLASLGRSYSNKNMDIALQTRVSVDDADDEGFDDQRVRHNNSRSQQGRHLLNFPFGRRRDGYTHPGGVDNGNGDDDDDDDDNDNDGNYNGRRSESTVRPFSALQNRIKRTRWQKMLSILKKYMQFIGPGFMVSVAYMDPGNYSTDVSAGAAYQYKLLFVVLLSNLFAAFLQSLCAKLGSVTGLDLAENCRERLPRWLCIVLYLLAEAAIVATDLAEVIGTAISLNILFHIPLIAGVAITIVDVLIVLVAYRPNGTLKAVRIFESAVACLVAGVVICFIALIAKVSQRDTISAGGVFRGYLPSKSLIEPKGIYLACGILGATVMPHSLYLGSGLVQPRMRDYDERHGNFTNDPDDSVADIKYRPSVDAIRWTLKYTLTELCISLFTFALFVNSAILIVGGATMYGNDEMANDADLFGIYEVLKNDLSKAAGLLFVVALLFSGQSAGIICTLAGQMVSEGFLHWTMRPWLRRLITRSIAIVPCIVVTAIVGRNGLNAVLNASQVALTILLPFVSAPLIYFTCRKDIMKVPFSRSVQRGGVNHSTSLRSNRSSISVSTATRRSQDTTINANDDSAAAATTNLLASDTNNSHEPIRGHDNNNNINSNNVEESRIQDFYLDPEIDLLDDNIEYVDMSNSLLTATLAVLIWIFICILNVYLLIQLGLGQG